MITILKYTVLIIKINTYNFRLLFKFVTSMIKCYVENHVDLVVPNQMKNNAPKLVACGDAIGNNKQNVKFVIF